MFTAFRRFLCKLACTESSPFYPSCSIRKLPLSVSFPFLSPTAIFSWRAFALCSQRSDVSFASLLAPFRLPFILHAPFENCRFLFLFLFVSDGNFLMAGFRPMFTAFRRFLCKLACTFSSPSSPSCSIRKLPVSVSFPFLFPTAIFSWRAFALCSQLSDVSFASKLARNRLKAVNA